MGVLQNRIKKPPEECGLSGKKQETRGKGTGSRGNELPRSINSGDPYFQLMPKKPILNMESLIENEKIICRDNKQITIHRLPRSTTIILPRQVLLSREWAWAIGFYVAEGSKTYSGIGIANREMSLVKRFKGVLGSHLSIPSDNWRAYIKSPEKDLKKVKDRWEARLKMRTVNVNHSKLATGDIIELRLNSTLLSTLFGRLVRRSLILIKKRKGLAISFLDGYEVGDGSIIQRKGFL